MGKTLFDKVWALHKVAELPNGNDQLLIGLHLIHEVTSPQAFQMLAEKKLNVLYPNRTFATVDHIVPTDDQSRPFADELAESMMQALENNTRQAGIPLFDFRSTYQGIVHVVGPELGLTQPGMTIACGDSHTSTHGAFGAIAFGIGTSQIRDVLASQTLSLAKPKVKKIEVTGKLGKGVYAKDIILRIIHDLGVKGGIGFAYEYGGDTIAKLDMEARLTICNMSIEGGARCGYINPDETTFRYIKGRVYAPPAARFNQAVAFWKSLASDQDAVYADHYQLEAETIEPMITWGITPGQSIGLSQTMPAVNSYPVSEQESIKLAYQHMQFKENEPIQGKKINVAFLGSCTNGRISDLREAAKIVRGRHVHQSVQALVVPGSMQVAAQAKAEGLDQVFREAGFEWRQAGCSMCLAMNPDKLKGDQLCASSSNRNFIGRQGSSTGRTLLMSPAMTAAAAIAGEVSDCRQLL